MRAQEMKSHKLFMKMGFTNETSREDMAKTCNRKYSMVDPSDEGVTVFVVFRDSEQYAVYADDCGEHTSFPVSVFLHRVISQQMTDFGWGELKL